MNFSCPLSTFLSMDVDSTKCWQKQQSLHPGALEKLSTEELSCCFWDGNSLHSRGFSGSQSYSHMQATAGRFFLGLLSPPFSFSHFHGPVHGPSRCLWLCSPSDLQYNLILTQTWEWSCPHCHSPLMFLMQILCLATYLFSRKYHVSRLCNIS